MVKMDYLDQFQEHISNNNYPAFLNLWEEYCMGDSVDPEELKRILVAATTSSFVDSFGKYVEQGLDLWQKITDPDQSHQVIKLIFDIQTSDTSSLIDLAIQYLDNRYESDPRHSDNIRLIGLRDRQQCRSAISKYELLRHMNPGNFVFHTAGWGVGEIMDVSFIREQLRLEFDYVSGFKDFSFENAFKTLIPLPADHFLSLRFGRPDYLEEKARNHPVEVIHMLLRDLGPKTASDIKDEMCELVIPSDDWVRWWQNTRTKLRKDTKIIAPESSKEPFQLRKEELPHEERLSQALTQNLQPEALIQLIYTHLRDFPQTLKIEDFKQSLQQKLSEALSYPEMSIAQKLQVHYFLQDLQNIKDYPPINEILLSQPIPALIDAMDIIAFKKRTLIAAQTLLPNWIELYQSMFLTVEPNTLRELILQELLKAKKRDLIEQQLEVLLAAPEKYPSACLWYFQKILGKNDLPLNTAEGRCRFFDAFFILMSHLERQDDREGVKRMIALMTKGRFAIVRKIMQGASKEATQEFLLLASKCHSIEDHDLKILHSLAEVTHPSLKALRKEVQEEVDQTIWTTQAGLDSIKARIETIGTVEMIENAKEIEEARAHGDLRENAEFKAACERRNRLQAEMHQLSRQLKLSSVIGAHDVDTSSVSVGTIIDCEDASGEKSSFTILGPWDADPDHRILSYQSKLAMSMMGKRAGESFQYQSGTYKILSIRNYFV